MTKGRDLPRYVHRRPRDGVLLLRKRVGKKIQEIRLETQFPDGAIIPFALHQEVERLLRMPNLVAPGKDIAAVLRSYRASERYADLKPRSKENYEPHLAYFAEKLGELRPTDIERPHVLSWRAAWAEKHSPHFANRRVSILALILDHAKDMGLLSKSDDNVAKGIRALKYERKERRPWPDTKVAAMRKAYPIGTRERLLFELLIGTGQRIGDVLPMQWNHIDGDGIRVKQNKTGKPLWIPITPQLRAALDAAERRALFIVPKFDKFAPRAGQLSYRAAFKMMMAARVAIGATEYDLHSLRYTAASELLRAGCDDDLIAAVTGQSQKMVEHYTSHVRQRVRATEAQRRRTE